jgi:hypothetical protein
VSQKCKLAELLQNEWHAVSQEENALSIVVYITFIIQCFMIVGFYFIINWGPHTHTHTHHTKTLNRVWEKLVEGEEIVEAIFGLLFTSALVGGEWSASRPCRFTPRERTPGTRWIGSWVSPRAGLDYVEKRKLLTAPGLLRPLYLAQPVAGLYTDYASNRC